MRTRILPTMLLLALVPSVAPAQDKKANEAIKEIAGSAEFLRAVPKKFGEVIATDEVKHTVTLKLDGEEKEKEWPLTPDAEVKVLGWWGRLPQLRRMTRAWAWFKVNRNKEPVAIFMLADEVSEQHIHGDGYVVKSVTNDKIVLIPPKGKDREVPVAKTMLYREGKKAPTIELLNPKDRVYLFFVPKSERWMIWDSVRFEAVRAKQKARLRNTWESEGLPGTIGLLHVYSGETDVLLDHEAMRWGRSLKPGDKVELAADPPIKGVVKSVTAQREKTQVRLVAKCLDLSELATGQRVQLKMTAPPPAVDNDALPPDIDWPRTKGERIEWFLANTYCTCGVGGDGCTGHFYTLASCNPNACGAPNATRKKLAAQIEKGLTDRQIFEEMLRTQGPLLTRPHLLP